MTDSISHNPKENPYRPCEPCLREDHDNCTGDCPSMCCALAAAEKEVERLSQTELTRDHVLKVEFGEFTNYHLTCNLGDDAPCHQICSTHPEGGCSDVESEGECAKTVYEHGCVIAEWVNDGGIEGVEFEHTIEIAVNYHWDGAHDFPILEPVLSAPTAPSLHCLHDGMTCEEFENQSAPRTSARPTDEQIIEALLELKQDGHARHYYHIPAIKVYETAIDDAADIVSKMLLPLTTPRARECPMLDRYAVFEALQNAWNEWVGDTECVPGCFEIHGPRTTRIVADFNKEPNFLEAILWRLNQHLDGTIPAPRARECPTNDCDSFGNGWAGQALWGKPILHCPDCGQSLASALPEQPKEEK